MFREAFDGKTEEKVKDSKSTTYFTTEIRHFLHTFVVLKLFLPLDPYSICLNMAACCSRFVPASKCCCVEAWSAKNFKHSYYYLDLSYFVLHNSLKRGSWGGVGGGGGGSSFRCSLLKLPYVPMFPHVFLFFPLLI